MPDLTTAETLIGTFPDGKKLYRQIKYKTFSTPKGASQNIITITPTNMAQQCYAVGWVEASVTETSSHYGYAVPTDSGSIILSFYNSLNSSSFSIYISKGYAHKAYLEVYYLK